DCSDAAKNAGDLALTQARDAAHDIAAAQRLQVDRVISSSYASQPKNAPWYVSFQQCGTGVPEISPPGTWGGSWAAPVIRVSRTVAIASATSGTTAVAATSMLPSNTDPAQIVATPSTMPQLDIRFPAVAISASVPQYDLPQSLTAMQGSIAAADARALRLAN